jgi:hypothetical protein
MDGEGTVAIRRKQWRVMLFTFGVPIQEVGYGVGVTGLFGVILDILCYGLGG